MNEERQTNQYITLEKRKDLLFAQQAFERLDYDASSSWANRKALQKEIAEISSLSMSSSELNEDNSIINEQLQNGKWDLYFYQLTFSLN